jgi:selenide,water dikinase
VTRRLTQFSHGAGCACKLAPGLLAEVLSALTPPTAPELLVGTETGDDAAVWRLDADRALVATADFFTPLVDDARTWGRIAAQNAASDVYAMGGRPLFALNLVAWPSSDCRCPSSRRCSRARRDRGGGRVRGGRRAQRGRSRAQVRAGSVGEAHPDQILRNRACATATRWCSPSRSASGSPPRRSRSEPRRTTSSRGRGAMTASNAAAARAAITAGAAGCTDVTGFGLLGTS